MTEQTSTSPPHAVRIIVADDDLVTRTAVSSSLRGYPVTVVDNGRAALEQLSAVTEPCVAVLDWEMPGMTGPHICSDLRRQQPRLAPYLIILTAHDRPDDVVTSLRAGADDYLTKPFHAAELRARVEVGVRVVTMQATLVENVRALEESLAQVKQLRTLLPICAYCKRIRDDNDYWQQLEMYITEQTGSVFTHGICPPCFAKALGRTTPEP